MMHDCAAQLLLLLNVTVVVLRIFSTINISILFRMSVVHEKLILSRLGYNNIVYRKHICQVDFGVIA